MEVTKWLKHAQPDFSALAAKEKKAIKDFALLWSLYEGTILANSGSVSKIGETVSDLARRGKVSLIPFRTAILYFRHRYYDGTNLTAEFTGLRLRPPDNGMRVETFIRSHAIADEEALIALLTIIYRIRNNLFHGVKWTDAIRGQYDNFRHANKTLMAIIELHR